jgi:hypothetical protein
MESSRALLLASCFALASCTSNLSSEVVAPVIPQASPSVKTIAPSLQEDTDVQFAQDFEEVLRNSCSTALKVGLEESSRDLNVEYILFPEELSIEGYSALEHDLKSDEVTLVWETDVFYTCYFSNRMALAEEFGASTSISFEAVSDGYSIVDESVDETFYYQVKVTDGLISEFDDGNNIWQVKYGVGENKLALLKRAVKDFLD